MGIEIKMTESSDAIVIISPDGKKNILISVGSCIDGKGISGNLVILTNTYKELFHKGYEQDVIVVS